MAVLTPAARLSNELPFNLAAVTDSFTIRYLRLTYICLYRKFTSHTINKNIKMQLSHPWNNSLTALFICFNPKRRILLSKFTQGNPHLFLISFSSRLNCYWNNRLRKLHALENNFVTLCTKCITRSGVFKTNSGCDIASTYFLNLFPAIGMHLYHTTNALALHLDRIKHRSTTF